MRKGGIKQISVPARGKCNKERLLDQKQPWFKRLRRFRAGVEARISLLQRKFGLKRSLMRGSPRTEIWVGQGIFTHNQKVPPLDERYKIDSINSRKAVLVPPEL